MPNWLTPPTPALKRFEAALKSRTKAELRFDRAARGLYATDASLYEIPPLGIVLPRTADDVAVALALAAEEKLPVLPRGGATSLSGQTVGEAIVVDFSKFMNRIGVVDRDRNQVFVEPGVVLDQLGAHLKPLGLMFGPDVSTSDRATLGGMIGNNSAGARSLRYGKTVDHVLRLDTVLDDGTPAHFAPLDEAELARTCSGADRIAQLHRTVRDTVARHRTAIETHFPHILRRVSGYNLDEFVPGLPVRAVGWPDEPFRFNMSRLIVGSEGTLAMVTGAWLKVVPTPRAQALVVLSYDSIPAALDSLGAILETRPIAVEMLDRMILDLAAQQPDLATRLTFATGRPEAVLAAQYHGDSGEELAERADQLRARLEHAPGVLGIRVSSQDAAKDDFWKVRKAGLSLLMGMIGDAKPVAFVEDTAVSPERLPEFYERFGAIVRKHDARFACYGHADVGCLHLRPILNMKKAEDVAAMQAIAREVSDLVLEFRGAMSGEHGDGLARSRWNRKLFGEEVYHAFQTIKQAFDPGGRMNPGKVVAEPDLGDHLRIGPAYHAPDPPHTQLDWSRQGGFARAVELCSGVGACRKPTGGTMCPSYMITRDEDHSTRGRANLLRLAISGRLPEGLAGDELHAALDLCLGCKACKAECPSNVDMAKLKAEALHQRHRSHGTPLGALLLGHVHWLARAGSALAPVSNWIGHFDLGRWLLESLTGIDRRRKLPTFRHDHLKRWLRKRGGSHPRSPAAGKVVLLDDCFTTYHGPEVGIAAIELLEAAGYEVQLAGITCCGRAAFSKGLLDLAGSLARDTLERLEPFVKSGLPILGCEPSCLTMLTDEYRDMRLGSRADQTARRADLVDAFLARSERFAALRFQAIDQPVILHGHCQQKATLGMAGTRSLLSRIPGIQLDELDSGCCGMAGSFGYERSHHDLSVALAERVLLPAIRENPDARVVAPGFSCRSQIEGLSRGRPVHPVQLLAECLSGASFD
jgi:FAD/FMN-containing dehydrogenase/Fe-S oxidoreductase